jgi:predicted nucleic acid-binding protein
VERVFLDANVLFSAAYSKTSGLQRLWDLPRMELCTSRYAVVEAHRNLTSADQRSRLDELLRSVAVVDEPPQRLRPALSNNLPEKDVPILFAAIHAQATHLLTGEVRHFGKLFGSTISGVMVTRPAMYLRNRHAET